MALTPEIGLLAATALHLGTQAVVTAVVYPALAEVPPERWTSAHAAHSRRITYVVAPVYTLLAAACLGVLLAGPRTPLLLLAVAAAAAAALSTALVAAPTHGRLGREGPTPELLSRLRTSDGVRLAAGVTAAGAALLAVLTG
jgi:hypothetical protein